MRNGVASIPVAGSPLHAQPAFLGRPDRRLTMHQFLAGPENDLAAAAVGDLLQEQLRHRPSPLVLYGRSGVGKSHLARGLARKWKEPHRPGKGVVATSGQFSRQLKRAMQADALPRFRGHYRCASLLVLEEVDSLPAENLAVQRELIHTLDAIHDANGMVIMTSRVPIGAILGLHPLLASRLVAGLVLLLSPPTSVTRLEILRRLATALGLPIPDHSIRLLADKVTGTVPDLLPALLKRHPAGAAIQCSTDTDARRSWPSDRARNTPPDIPQIISTTARYFSLKPSQLRGASRKRSIVLARGTAIYLARRLTGQSYNTIGHCFGGRDHTTVLYNYRKLERLLRIDTETRVAVTRLNRILATNTI